MDGRAILFGCINSVITIPVMIAFCKVIFQEPEFEPYQAMLVRLVFLVSPPSLTVVSRRFRHMDPRWPLVLSFTGAHARQHAQPSARR